MCLSPHVMHKGKHETSVGEAHLDDKMEFNRENHEIQKAMDQIPGQSWTKTDPRVGRSVSYIGRLAQPIIALPRALSTVRFESRMIYFHLSRFLF